MDGRPLTWFSMMFYESKTLSRFSIDRGSGPWTQHLLKILYGSKTLNRSCANRRSFCGQKTLKFIKIIQNSSKKLFWLMRPISTSVATSTSKIVGSWPRNSQVIYGSKTFNRSVMGRRSLTAIKTFNRCSMDLLWNNSYRDGRPWPGLLWCSTDQRHLTDFI